MKMNGILFNGWMQAVYGSNSGIINSRVCSKSVLFYFQQFNSMFSITLYVSYIRLGNECITVDNGYTWVCNYLNKVLVLITSIVYAQKSFTINNRKQHYESIKHDKRKR